MTELIKWPYRQLYRGINVVLAPWHSMHDPIQHLLNTGEEEANVLTAKWVQAKLAEYNYIGITVRPSSRSYIG